MVRISFCPFTINYKTIGNRAVIHMYGRTGDLRQICVTDTFRPYFYAEIKGNAKEFSEKVKNLQVVRGELTAIVEDAETVEKVMHAKKKELVKIYCDVPASISIIRGEIRNYSEVISTYEHDILFTRRYLIDKDITPMRFINIDAEYINQKSKVSVARLNKIHDTNGDVIPERRILSLAIQKKELSDSEDIPVSIIALFGKDFKKVLTWQRFNDEKNETVFASDEKEMLILFKEFVEQYKPDIICSYNADDELAYLAKRAKANNVALKLGLDYSEITIGKKKTTITGMVNLNISRFLNNFIKSSLTSDMSLSNAAKELLNEQNSPIPNDIEGLCKHTVVDSVLTHKLALKLMPNMIEIVKIVGLSPEVITRMGISRLVEWHLIRQSSEEGMLIPNRPTKDEIIKRRQQSYEGSYVRTPEPGLYKNVAVFDFRSLYPSIIISHNIGPDNLILSEPAGESEKVPEKPYWFSKTRKGFIPKILELLVSRRLRIKEIIKNKGDDESVIVAREQTLKLLANSFYGYLAFFGARWYSLQCAESVTAYGRHYIKRVINESEKKGFKVIYTDTDSLFLKLDDKTPEDAKRFIEDLNRDLPDIMELEYEGFYPKALFVHTKSGISGAKKKYAVVDDKGHVKIRGFEAVRSNWAPIAKKTQEHVIRAILKGDVKSKAVQIVQQTIKDIRDKNVPINEMIIKTQLLKPIGEYDTKPPHVAVALRMKKAKIKVQPKMIIRYVITPSGEKIGDKARTPEEATEYDADYYINNQVLPAVERIFEVIGVDSDELIKNPDQSNLDSFIQQDTKKAKK